jgi:hypothetical protein
MTLAENKVDFTSKILDMSKGEHLAPDFARKNPIMMLPTLDLEPQTEKGGRVLLDSREICKHSDKLDYSYFREDCSKEVGILLDLMYSECIGSLAWLTGFHKICFLRFGITNGLLMQKMGNVMSKYAQENADLAMEYDLKFKAME